MTENLSKTADLIKQYESLRLSKDQKTTQYEQEYFCLVYKGMISWMIEINANMLQKQKPIIEKFPKMNLEDSFHPKQSQISQTITDILLNKIKGRASNDIKPRKSTL